MSNVVSALLPALSQESGFIQVETGRPVGASWVTVEDAADPDDGVMDRLLARAWSNPERPAVVAARDAFAGFAWQVVLPQVMVLARQQRLPVLESSTTLVDIDAGEPARVAWDTTEILVLDDDPLVGEPGVSTVDSVDLLYRYLVDWTVAAIDPLVAAIKERVTIGRPLLWGAVVDCFTWIGPDVTNPHPTTALDDLARFETAARHTPLSMRIPLIEVGSPTGTRLQVGRAKCCLYYKEPVGTEGEMPVHLQSPWQRYCTTCPLVPEEETIRRLVHQLQESEETETV